MKHANGKRSESADRWQLAGDGPRADNPREKIKAIGSVLGVLIAVIVVWFSILWAGLKVLRLWVLREP